MKSADAEPQQSVRLVADLADHAPDGLQHHQQNQTKSSEAAHEKRTAVL